MPDGVGVVGLGRLGRGIVAACARLGQPVVLTVSRTGGWPASEVPSVIIDASAPEAQARVVDYCGRHGVALVECVSNLSQGQWAELGRLAGRVPVVRATNLTVGHYVHGRLVECLAALGVHAAFRPETSVLERHPATKAHRPSATAVALARIWSDGTGTEVAEICSRRAGPPVSEHEVQWTWPAETLVLRHSVHRIDAAAAGALAAARWTRGRPPGLVGMRDVYDDLTSDLRSSA